MPFLWKLRLRWKRFLSRITVVDSFCKRCGGPVRDFCVSDSVWRIVEEQGYTTLCYNCFCDIMGSANFGGTFVLRKNREDIFNFIKIFNACDPVHRAVLLDARCSRSSEKFRLDDRAYISIAWHGKSVIMYFDVDTGEDDAPHRTDEVYVDESGAYLRTSLTQETVRCGNRGRYIPWDEVVGRYIPWEKLVDTE